MPPNVMQKKVSARYQKHEDPSSTGSSLLCDVAVLQNAGTICMEAWLLNFFREPAHLLQECFLINSSGVLMQSRWLTCQSI